MSLDDETRELLAIELNRIREEEVLADRDASLYGEPMAAEQVEKENMPTAAAIASRAMSFPNDPLPNVPFSFINRHWITLKEKWQPGDVFMNYSTPEESWKLLFGRSGVALVRNGKIVDFLDTVVN